MPGCNMIKQHSRKQIIEAIRYWKGVLQKINESKSELLDACSKEFGEAVVFDDKNMSFELNHDSLKLLFSIFDKYLFNNKLKTINDLSLFTGNPSQLAKTALQYTNGNLININDYFAFYQPDYRIFKNIKTGQIKINIIKEAIFINIDSHKSSTFAYAATNLCHEMIHCYDMHFGKLYSYMAWAIQRNVPSYVIAYNSHLTTSFKQKKTEFKMKTSIDILDNGNDYSFEKFNEIASKDIKFLKENDNDWTIPGLQAPFSKETIDFYRNSDSIFISDDGMSFSFRFGTRMPKQ